MFWWFSGKKEVKQLKEEIKDSFDVVKKDINSAGKWITHLNSHKTSTSKDLELIKADLSTIKNEVEQLKELLSLLGHNHSKQLFKTNRQLFNKQTAVQGVQTPVQTAVQTGKFYGISNLSLMERAIVWVLVNSEMKLGYDDLSTMLGKDRATVRGQINAIKKKSEGLIFEQIERSGKKRLYIPNLIKEKLLKRAKVSVDRGKKAQKIVKNE